MKEIHNKGFWVVILNFLKVPAIILFFVLLYFAFRYDICAGIYLIVLALVTYFARTSKPVGY